MPAHPRDLGVRTGRSAPWPGPVRARDAFPQRLSDLELFVGWQRCGDRRAQDELVRRYLPLARRLARRYKRSSVALEDLSQVASMALVRSINNFDPDRGTAFTPYAALSILGELRRYFRDSTWALHVSRAAQECAQRVDRARRELTETCGRSPSVAELARHLTMDHEVVIDALQTQQAYGTSSLDTPLADPDSGSLIDRLGCGDTGYDWVEERSSLAPAMRLLSEREQRILYLRFFEDRTQSQIGVELGISQMQISRLMRTSIEKLRRATARAA